jgi:uridine phosphorylase
MTADAHPSHHLRIVPDHVRGNGGLGRYFLLPGSPARARQLAELFDERTEDIVTPRHNDTFLGRIHTPDGRPIDVAATSTGMGPGSTEIVATELILNGARRLIRVGTSGSVQWQTVKVGAQVIATGAVRDELASQHYVCLEYPAVAHPDTVLAAERAAFAMGIADRTYKGVVHTKGSLYARAVFVGPRKAQHEAYKEEMIAARVLASEMEASVLFVVSQTLSPRSLSLAEERAGGRGGEDVIKAGTLLGIIGGEDSWASEAQIRQIEEESCLFALETVRQLHALDRREGPA